MQSEPLRETPGISIVTSASNVFRHIIETVVSVTSQMQLGDEHIIVDDRSTDGTDILLKRLAEIHKFKLLKRDTDDEASAVDVGVAAASNDIICVLNGDSPILPGLLARMRDTFEEEPGLVAAYPDWLMIDEDGTVLLTVRTLPFSYDIMLSQHLCIPGPGAFFRRSALGDKPIRDRRAEGVSVFDFWLRLRGEDQLIRRVPEILATSRSYRTERIVSSSGASLAKAKIDMIDRFFRATDLPGHIRALEDQARSAAYYDAALVGLRHSEVPVIRYALASFRHMPIWASDSRPSKRRSLSHIVYAAAQPVSGWCRGAIDSLLPDRFRASSHGLSE